MARTDNKSNEREVTNVNMTKISAVMRPAQKDATARLLKTAAFGGYKITGGVMPDKIDYAAEAKNLAEGMVKELGIEDKIDVLSASIQTALEKQSESHSEAITSMGEKMADLEKMAGMNDFERAYMNKMDDAAKKAFMGMIPEDRKKKMDAMKKSDEAIEYDGQTLIKSQTDPAMYAMVKSMIKKNEDLEKAQAEALEKAEFNENLAKARAEFSHLPLKDIEVADMIKSVNALPENKREALFNLMKSKSEDLKLSKKELGTNQHGELDDSDEMQKMVKSHAKEKGISEAEAEVALMATEEYQKLYNNTI